MHWLWLAIAIVLEVCGTVSMKMSAGFTKLVPSVLMAVFYAACFSCMTVALKRIDVSVAYAVWSGMGTALIMAVGVMYFREPMTLLKAASTILIIAGVIGLNIGTGNR